MHASDQKKEEKFFVEESLRIAGINATIVSQNNHPYPDTIIEYNGEKIGLEHTELFKSKNIQALQKYANDVTAVAYESYQGPASSIYPVFEYGRTKVNPKDVGEKLAAFCAGASDGMHHDLAIAGSPLPGIKSVRISRYPSELKLTQSAWRSELDHSGESMISALKTSIIEKEEKRKKSYSTVIARNWLLITLRPIQDSQFFHWSPVSFDGALVDTGFERIILCDLSFSQWFDIPTSEVRKHSSLS